MWDAGDWGPLERFVAEEYIADTLWAFEPGFRRGAIIPAAEQLGTLPLPGDHPERCQFLVAETLFGEMLALPNPRHKAVFYHVVIQDLCAAIPTFPKMMAKVVGAMFAQIARMELEARERLADWMAHHLSCFDLAWPWKSWAHVAAQSREHPQRRFCESVVRRLLRSCFQKRVEDSLPEELRSALMPAYAMSANGAGVPGVNAKYLEDLSARARFAKRDEANDAEQTQTRAELDALAEVSALVKTKTPASAVVGWFQDSGARTTLGDATCAETLTAAALRHGQKCLTHHDVLLRRYAPALAEFQSSPEERETLAAGTAVTRAASGVWAGTHPRMAVAAVSRVVALAIVPPAAVARWLETRAFAFEDDAEEAARWGGEDAFEIAAEAVGARAAAATRAEVALRDAEARLAEARRAASAAEAAREDAEQRDALVQRDQFARTAQAHRDRARLRSSARRRRRRGRRRRRAPPPPRRRRRRARRSRAGSRASRAWTRPRRGCAAQLPPGRTRGATPRPSRAPFALWRWRRRRCGACAPSAASRSSRRLKKRRRRPARARRRSPCWARRFAGRADSKPPRPFRPRPRRTSTSRWRSEADHVVFFVDLIFLTLRERSTDVLIRINTTV